MTTLCLVCDFFCRCICPCRDPDLPPAINPIRIVSGRLNQEMIPSTYNNNQCTSMCLATLAWWSQQEGPAVFTTRIIDANLFSGNSLHAYLRAKGNTRCIANSLEFLETLQVSNVCDLRVALDDLPDCFEYEGFRFIRDPRAEEFALLYNLPGECKQGGLTMFKTFLQRYMGSPFGVLITVDALSQCIMYTSRGTWLVYDPHGFVGYKCYMRRVGATVWEFATVDAVVGFLADIHWNDRYCQVIKPRFETVGQELATTDLGPFTSVQEGSVTGCKSAVDAECTAVSDAHALCITEGCGDGGETPGVSITVSVGPVKPVESLSTSQDSGCDMLFEEEDDGYVSFMGGFGWD